MCAGKKRKKLNDKSHFNGRICFKLHRSRPNVTFHQQVDSATYQLFLVGVPDLLLHCHRCVTAAQLSGFCSKVKSSKFYVILDDEEHEGSVSSQTRALLSPLALSRRGDGQNCV